jgi:hypothetical protein
MTTQHTPGPWTISGGFSNRVYLINDAKGFAIGETVYADTRNPADARLIAAAPDMLAALQHVLERATMPGFLRDEVKAAIARATVA